MTSNQPKYDVAISFLSKDEPIAAALHDLLSEGLDVFFYPRRQEELAGTDGLETLRPPFYEDSRIIVVLYRAQWGKTPWTGVEQTAIQERCLKQGWDCLFFIMLDESPAPVWVPTNYIRLNYSEFGLEQAVGAIKGRVQETGGIIKPLTAIKQAQLYEQEALYFQDRKEINSQTGINKINQSLPVLFEEISRLCAEIKENGNISIRVGYNAGRCVLTDNRVSLVLGWVPDYSKGVDGWPLKVIEYNAQMALPGESLMYFSNPEELRMQRFFPELSRAREYGWVERDKPSQFLSSNDLADKCVRQFLNLATRANQGKVNPPPF